MASYDPKKLLKDFEGKKVNKSDKSSFFDKMSGLIDLRYLKIMWHIIWHLDCAKKIFDFGEIAMITTAVAYVVSPLDAVPDVIPIIGLLDDATVMAFVIKMLKDLLDRYKEQCM